MKIQRRYTQAQKLRAREDGRLEQRVAVFDDPVEIWPGYWEEVAPEAFDRTLEEGDPRALLNHDPNMLLGRKSTGTAEFVIDGIGLSVVFDPGETSVAANVRYWMERGDLDGGSFSFYVMKSDTRRDGDTKITRLTDVELLDAGPVVFPAYPGTSGRSLDGDALTFALLKVRAGVPITAEERQALALAAADLRMLAEPLESEEPVPAEAEPEAEAEGEDEPELDAEAAAIRARDLELKAKAARLVRAI